MPIRAPFSDGNSNDDGGIDTIYGPAGAKTG